MGQLIDGRWFDDVHIAKSKNGKFRRKPTAFHGRITADGSSGFKAEANRYHLYISLACPWACRTLIFRKLKKLEDIISLSIVHPLMHENGWTFSQEEGCIPDTINDLQYMHQVYAKAAPDYTGRASVPVLWDKQTQTIVDNESAEIIRMLNCEFQAFTDDQTDYYPEKLRAEIDEINAYIYTNINNGVYKCGFATTQEAYDGAFDDLFKALDTIEDRLGKSRYLVDSTITEADWRLFTTLVRFDAVYYSHFKCNLKRIKDYPNLSNYLRDLYQVPGIADTVNMDHIKRHYYGSHKHINPTGIVPKGPELDFKASHDRDRFKRS